MGQKKGRQALNRLRERGEERTAGRAGHQPAVVVSCDEMWTYRGARHGAKREEWWIWTAVVAEADGSRWVDFEVGDRSEVPFLRLYARLPEAGLYRSDAYAVYLGWFPPDRHVVGKGTAVNWNEGLHSVWRGQLRRLMRRTKGYTKSIEMLVYSLALVCWQRWAKFNIPAR